MFGIVRDICFASVDSSAERLSSSSYAPEAGHAQHDAMLQQLQALFDAHQKDGQVTIHYDTNVYFGQL